MYITFIILTGAADAAGPDCHPPDDEPPSTLMIFTIFGDFDDESPPPKKVACATAKQTARTMNTFMKIIKQLV